MRYMSIITTKPPGPPPSTPELVEAMNKLANRELQAGRMLDGAKLEPLDTGARVVAANGRLTVTDGPMVEAKEVIGGYVVFEFASKEEAVASALEFLQLHLDMMPGWEGTCEIRALATDH